MTFAAAFLLAAAAVALLAPAVLERASARGADPAVTLAAWLAAMVSVVATTAVGLALLLLPHHGADVLARVHDCWSSLGHGLAPGAEAAGGVVGLVLGTALLVRIAVVAVRGARRRASTRREHLALLRVAARREPGPPATLWLDHDEPYAFSLAGDPGVVVATEGLHRRLTDEQVEAVLTHERAHLAGRHHLLVAASDVPATVLPFVPLFRRAPAAVRDLVELAADAAAVRTCGVEAVRAALLRVSGGGAPGTALAMSRDAVELRLSHLERRRPRSAGDVLTCALTAAAVVVAPGGTAFAALLIAGCL